MTILFMARLFYPHIGGVERHVLEVSKQLIKDGYKIIVIAEQHDKDLPLKDTFKDITIYRIPVGKREFWKKFTIWMWFWKNRFILKNAKIVHCHDVFFWYLPFIFLYPQKPVFATFHGFESFPVRKTAMIQRKIAEKLSWGNICIGEYIRKWYGAKPTIVTYGGVTIPKIYKPSIEKLSAVFVGRLDKDTGIETYIAALAKIQKKHPTFSLQIVGDGQLREEIERELPVEGFHFSVGQFYTRNHYAFVSGYLSILEAMAHRRLVFATYDNLLKRDYLELTPFAKSIIICEDEDDIAQQVLHYLQNPGAEKEKVDAADNWVQMQTWRNVTNTYLNLWNLH